MPLIYLFTHRGTKENPLPPVRMFRCGCTYRLDAPKELRWKKCIIHEHRPWTGVA